MRIERQQLFSGIARGVVLGFVYSIFEALVNIPVFAGFRYQQPIAVSCLVLGVNLLLCGVLGALASPLLRWPRRNVWHAAASWGLLAALILALTPQFEFRRWFDVVLLVVVAAFYALTLRLGELRPLRGARIRGLVGVIATSIVLIAFTLPGAMTALPDHGPEAAAESAASGSNASRSSASEAAASGAAASGPNVLLVVLDTVRADRLGLLGYSRPTLPVLRQLAADGASFERALAPACWTLPTHASIFTGLYPSSHGAHNEQTSLPLSHTTMAEIFHRNGWQTAAFSSNFWIGRSSGLAQGFEISDQIWIPDMALNFAIAFRIAWKLELVGNDHGGQRVVRAWSKWLEQRDSDRPFFAYLNLIESHVPYHQLPAGRHTAFASPGVTQRDLLSASHAAQRRMFLGKPLDREQALLVGDLYDAGLLYDDYLLSQALDALAARGWYDDTLIVVVSDHGDLLGEHGMWTHTRSLTEPLLHVPMIWRWPQGVTAGLEIDTPVTTTAILPTLLQLLDLPAPEGLQTTSFAPLLRDPQSDIELSPLLAEQYGDPGQLIGKHPPSHPFDRLQVRYRALEEDGWKLIVDDEGNKWLFRPQDDPLEQRDLSSTHGDIVSHLEQQLAALVERYDLGALDGETEADMIERLKALGYVG